MSPDLVRVLVLYSHPLMGEGLGGMLAAEPGLCVESVDIGKADAVNAALARDPEIIVVEEGGLVDAADVVRRSRASLVLDVDITTTRAWTLRREILSACPDAFLAAIRTAVAGGAHRDADGARADGTGDGARDGTYVGASDGAFAIDQDQEIQAAGVSG